MSPGRSRVFRAACSTSAVQSPRDGNSSGVTTTGPSEIAKSRAFAPVSSGATQSFMSVKPPIAPSAPITAAIRRSDSTCSAPAGNGIASSGP